MAGAALEQISHLEILLRSTIDSLLAEKVKEDSRKIPWFLLPPFYTSQEKAIDEVRTRLRGQKRETRDQIVASLSFGFWTGWFGTKHEELWRKTLHRAFPHGSGHRKDISILVEQIRKFRNRIAHHDSLLNVDVHFEMEAIFNLARMINEDVYRWMKTEEVDRTYDIGREKPVTPYDTVVVPASKAWSFYESTRAYICQAGRSFAKVDHLAFYYDRKIQREVPFIRQRYDNVEWNFTKAEELLAGERPEKRLGKVMKQSLEEGQPPGRYQVFLLTTRGEQDHSTLDHELTNARRGKGAAFVRKQRYTSIHAMRHAHSVWDLED